MINFPLKYFIAIAKETEEIEERRGRRSMACRVCSKKTRRRKISNSKINTKLVAIIVPPLMRSLRPTTRKQQQQREQ